MPTPQAGLREASTLINKTQSYPQPQQQPDKVSSSVRHEKKKSSGDFSGNMFSKEDSSLFSIDSGSVQKSMDFVHAKSRNSLDGVSDRKSIGSIASLNTSCGSLQTKIEKETNAKMSSSVGNVSNSLTGQAMRQGVQAKNEPPQLAKWIKKEGPIRLYEALENLNLDIKSIDRVNLSALTYEQLCNEKKNVKNELKKYDAEFALVFKRNPEREEKEPMRPLYIYYKKIKQYLVKNAAKARNNKAVSTSQMNMGGNTYDKDGKTMKGTKNYPHEKENKGYGQTSAYDRKLDSSFEAQMSKEGFKERNQHNYHEEDRRDLYERNYKQSSGKGQGNVGLSTQEQIRRQLEEYRGFRLQLREKLHSYQTEFTKNNSRKIKYHKDIAPVENEYKQYKEIKQEITKLEGLLTSYG